MAETGGDAVNPTEIDPGSFLFLALGPVSIAVILGAIVYFLRQTHKRP